MRLQFLRPVKGDGKRFNVGEIAAALDFPAETVKWLLDAGYAQPVVEMPAAPAVSETEPPGVAEPEPPKLKTGKK